MNPRQYAPLIIAGVAIVAIGIYYYQSPERGGSAGNPEADALSKANQVPEESIGADGIQLLSYQNTGMSLSFQYSPRYFVSETPETSGFIKIKLNKTKDRETVKGAAIDRTAHMEIMVYKTVQPPLLSMAQAWGEDASGSKFNANTYCGELQVEGENALECSMYAGADKGGYRDAIFVNHAGKTYQFEAMSPTNTDIVHTDILRTLTTVRWQ